MKFNTLLILFYIYTLHPANTICVVQNFSRPAFYSILASGKLEEINEELTLLSDVAVPEKEAYEGTLLMRKAGLVKIPHEKLKFFKKGRIKLETALLTDNKNCEYHFLRLIIQEHAPKIVKYSSHIMFNRLFLTTAKIQKYYTLKIFLCKNE
jgi:hypothetical protein